MASLAAWGARLSIVGFVSLMMIWIFEEQGGLNLFPNPPTTSSSAHTGAMAGSSHGRRRLTAESGNDTSGIFNFHAFFFTWAYVVCMAESLLAYRSPLYAFETRRATKLFHHLLQAAILLFTALGLAAVVVSKDVTKPSPYKHLYSGHAWMGLATILLNTLQYVYGLWAFALPTGAALSPAARARHGRNHGFLGLFVWGLGMATVTNGLIDMQMMDTHSGTGHYTAASLETAGMCMFASVLALSVFWIFHDQPQRHPLPKLADDEAADASDVRITASA